MGSEQAQSRIVTGADYENPRLCLQPQYHPEILATRVVLKRAGLRESMRVFEDHQARAAAERVAKKRKEDAQKQSVCIALSVEGESTPGLLLDPEYSALSLLGRLASTMNAMVEPRS